MIRGNRAMWSFFERKTVGARDMAADHPAQVLLSDFTKTDRQSQQRTAQQLAQLWSGFLEEFEGPRPFLNAPQGRQNQYLERLDRIVERSRSRKDTELARFYFSAAMLRLYLEALRTDDTAQEAVALSQCLVALIDEGRDRRSAAAAA
jgi:hypothetical protein